MALSLIHNGKPVSVNHKKEIKDAFKTDMIRTLKQKFPSIRPYSMDKRLYGVVFYFYKVECRLDADNISKPLWDSFNNEIYVDDFQVKFRIASSFDLSNNNFAEIDTTNMDTDVMLDLIDSTVDPSIEHAIYVEVGEMNNKFYKFNLETLWK